MTQNATDAIDWYVSDAPVPYEPAIAAMERRVALIRDGAAGEAVWLLEHPPLYTAGTSARVEDLIAPDRFPVFQTGRGGEYTYHGPGQQVAYVMLDLTRRGRDVRAFVSNLEGWLIDTLRAFNVRGCVREGRVGVWVPRRDKGPSAEDKIAAIGIRVRQWVSFHGVSFNVEPDLDHFDGIVPCGISDQGVTSLVDLGWPVTMTDAQSALRDAFEQRFGRCQVSDRDFITDTEAAMAAR